MFSELLTRVEHRPFPLPTTPWVISQSWAQLLFAHWPIKPDEMRALVPQCLDLDLFDGSAWIGVIPFAMKDVGPRFTPKFGSMSNFLELNVRTYVVKNGIPGVYFFSLDCSNPVAVWVAKTFYYLPYFGARMSLTKTADHIAYRSQRAGSTAVKFSARYGPTGVRLQPGSGSIDTFLTERYCLYSTDKKGNAYRGVIHHDVWPLQPAEAEIDENTMTSPLGITLPDCMPLLHYAERIDTVCWSISSVD